MVRKYYCYGFIFLLASFISKAFAQLETPGLEGILVERYYETGKEDIVSNANASSLRLNATTYRIFVDLLPGYRFQAAYGSMDHPLFFRTNTFFYNHTDNGGFVASVIPSRKLGKNTVMLDSWISVGTAGEFALGIPKADDGDENIFEFEKGYLSHKTKNISIVPREKDGLKYTVNMPLHTFFGLDSVLSVFSYKVGNQFYVNNGAWACMGKGSIGADSLGHNRVLIAQLTTDGTLEFALNIQIGTPNGHVQRFVAMNPGDGEFTHPSLVRNKKRKKIKK